MMKMSNIALYIEDNTDSSLLMELLFPLHGLELEIFPDSYDVLARVKALPSVPKLFLLDIHVPPLSGFEILSLLREEAEYCQVPVLALTASVMNEEVQRLRLAGFNGVLPKPVDVQRFPEYVAKILAGESVWRINV
jgi:CheY-like chemotaxis protein